MAYPEACHIVPFSFNNTHENLAVTRYVLDHARCLLHPAVAEDLREKLACQLGCSDAAWSMLSLSPQLHDWWSRGLFAFYCLDTARGGESSTIYLRFCWMPSWNTDFPTPYSPVEIDDDEDLEQYMRRHAKSSHVFDETIATSKLKSSRNVFPSDHINIVMPHEHAEEMKKMINLQWVLIPILAMSGAAGAPGLLQRPDDTEKPIEIVKADKIQGRVEIVQDIQKSIQELYPDWQMTAGNLPLLCVSVSRSHLPPFFQERDACINSESNVCLVTGTAFPDACHIVPFAWNSNDTNIAATPTFIMGSCKLLEDPDALYDHLGQHLGSSNKDWNMIALSPQLHDWWDRDLWAFKCLGVVEEEPLSRIQLQFCWMVSKGSNPQREVDVEDEDEVSRDIACCSSRRKEGKVGIRNIHTSRGVMSWGHPEDEDAPRQGCQDQRHGGSSMGDDFLLTLSGAAGSTELLRDPDLPQDVLVESK